MGVQLAKRSYEIISDTITFFQSCGELRLFGVLHLQYCTKKGLIGMVFAVRTSPCDHQLRLLHSTDRIAVL